MEWNIFGVDIKTMNVYFNPDTKNVIKLVADQCLDFNGVLKKI